MKFIKNSLGQKWLYLLVKKIESSNRIMQMKEGWEDNVKKAEQAVGMFANSC